MESEISVVSTTSSTNLFNSSEVENVDKDDHIDEASANSTQKGDELTTTSETSNKSDGIQLIEGLAKPSSALEKVDFVRVSSIINSVIFNFRIHAIV